MAGAEIDEIPVFWVDATRSGMVPFRAGDWSAEPPVNKVSVSETNQRAPTATLPEFSQITGLARSWP